MSKHLRSTPDGEFLLYQTEDGQVVRIDVRLKEAIRSGFKKAWQEHDYATITIAAVRKIPEKILQEDSTILMWYDQALTRSGEE